MLILISLFITARIADRDSDLNELNVDGVHKLGNNASTPLLLPVVVCRDTNNYAVVKWSAGSKPPPCLPGIFNEQPSFRTHFALKSVKHTFHTISIIDIVRQKKKQHSMSCLNFLSGTGKSSCMFNGVGKGMAIFAGNGMQQTGFQI